MRDGIPQKNVSQVRKMEPWNEIFRTVNQTMNKTRTDDLEDLNEIPPKVESSSGIVPKIKRVYMDMKGQLNRLDNEFDNDLRDVKRAMGEAASYTGQYVDSSALLALANTEAWLQTLHSCSSFPLFGS